MANLMVGGSLFVVLSLVYYNSNRSKWTNTLWFVITRMRTLRFVLGRIRFWFPNRAITNCRLRLSLTAGRCSWRAKNGAIGRRYLPIYRLARIETNRTMGCRVRGDMGRDRLLTGTNSRYKT